MGHRNDINYGKYVDAGYGMRYSDSDVDHPSDDSDVSAPSRRSKSSLKASRSRGPKLRTLNRWTPEEHERLAYLVAKWGSEKNWAKVAEEMPGRTGKQCRERWLNHMRPGIIKGNWSFEEEFLLAQCHAVVGSHWSKMTKRLPGRTENSIKNFWNATLRSKAPHKRRGILWLYMQQQTSQEGENVDAFLISVSRLYENQELPTYWAQLMDEGRLTERTLRAVLRAEKEFLENPDAELHPLALPHPTHGLFGAPDTAATAVAAMAVVSAPESDTAYQPNARLQQQPNAQQPGNAQGLAAAAAAASAAAAAAAGNGYGPTSPLPVPGLTPRFPGGDVPAAAGHNGAAVPSSAAFDVTSLAGLSLPPEVLAALGPPEVWTTLPSAQARAGPFSGAGGMEPLMPGLGLTSDLRPSGTEGAFGGNAGGSSMLAAGQEQIWSCLPSFRGLGAAGCGGGPAAAGGVYTAGQGADPLKLLEPYGALHGHNHHHHSSSNNSMQHPRPDSALEYEQPPIRQQPMAGADSRLSRDSSSRPGSSLDQMHPEGLEPLTSAQQVLPGSRQLAADSHRHYQQQQRLSNMVGGVGSAAGMQRRTNDYANCAAQQPGANSPPDPHHSYQDPHGTAVPAAAQSTQAHHAWWGQANRQQPGMQAGAAAEYGHHSWAGQYPYQHQQNQQQQMRTSSPTESGTQNEQGCGAAQGPSVTAPYQTSGHGAHCNCNVCSVRFQHGGHTSQHTSPVSSLASSQAMAQGYGSWDASGHGSPSYSQQHYTMKPDGARVSEDSSHVAHAPAAWPGAAHTTQQRPGAPQQQQAHQQGLNHAASDGCMPSGHAGFHQHSHDPDRLNSVNSAPLPASHLQQHSAANSPFARHANAVWDTAGAAAAGPEAAAAVGYGHTNLHGSAGGAGHAGADWGVPELNGFGTHQQQPEHLQQQQQDQGLQQGQMGPDTSGGFSAAYTDSPRTGALQHLLDTAAAQAGLSTEDICAWLAAATNTTPTAQEDDDTQQQQPQQQDWLVASDGMGYEQSRPERPHSLGPLSLCAHDDSSNTAMHNNNSTSAQDATFACSILEALLTSRHSAQLGDMLLSPAGLASSAAMLHGSLPPTPAAATAALQAAMAGLKRERSLPEDADILIEQPKTKLPRVF